MSRLWTGVEDNPLADRTVLIAVQPLWVEPLVKALLEEGGHPLSVDKVEEVFPILQFEQPEFFILSEGFDPDVPNRIPYWDIFKICPWTKEERFL